MAKDVQQWLKRMPPVYNVARRLLLQFLASTAKADRVLRYGIVADTANLILSVMTDIAFADKYDIATEDRVSFISTAQVKMDEVKVRIRVIKDAQAIKTTGFSACTHLEKDVDYQLERWRETTLKK